MKAAELRKKNITELQKTVLELQKKLSDMHFKSAANQVKNTKEIGGIKKEIARNLTIINELKNYA